MSEKRGVQTNGVGKHSTAHMNFTRTLADAWGIPKELCGVDAPPKPKAPYAGSPAALAAAWRR